MKLKKSYLAILPLFVASQSNAFFTATGFGGTSLNEFLAVEKEFVTAAAQLGVDIQMAGTNMSSTVGSAMAETGKAVAMANMQATTDSSTMAMTQAQLDMNIKAELTGRQIMATKGIVHESDRIEEMKAISEFLRRDDIKDQNISDIVLYAEKNLDGKMKVRIQPYLLKEKTDQTKNIGEEVTLPNVSWKIEKLAAMCADNKRAGIDATEKTIAKSQTAVETAKTTQAIVESTNSGEVAEVRQKNQKLVSCSPNELELGMCGVGVSKEEYVDLVMKQEIIPNGNLSAGNFYSPQSFGGAGYLDPNDPSVAESMASATKDSLEPVTEGDGVNGVPDIKYTYRNSKQLNAAKSFSENIVNSFAVSNQHINDRNNPANSNFQSLFISRLASLNMAQNSFDTSMAIRRGTTLSTVSSGTVGKTVKERHDGAGSLDRLHHEVQEALKFTAAENADELAKSGKVLTMKLLKQSNLSNKILFEDLLYLERMELLMATLVANEVNSSENLKQMGEAR